MYRASTGSEKVSFLRIILEPIQFLKISATHIATDLLYEAT